MQQPRVPHRKACHDGAKGGHFLDDPPAIITEEVKRGAFTFMHAQELKAKNDQLLQSQMETTERQADGSGGIERWSRSGRRCGHQWLTLVGSGLVKAIPEGIKRMDRGPQVYSHL